MDTILPEPVAGLAGERREARQLGVRLIVAGQQRQRYPPLPADGRKLLDAVGPIADSAETVLVEAGSVSTLNLSFTSAEPGL